MFLRSYHTRRQWLLLPGVAMAAAAGLPLAATAAAPAAGQPAPDFALRGLDGQNLRLREQRGHVVLLNFWASWCGPCREEMPQLSRLHDKYRAAGLQLLGVNVDDDASNAASVATKLAVKFPVLLDTDKQVSKLYDISAMPSTVLIDRDGRVRHLHKGYREGTAQAYEQQIRELLKD
jgi:peroxiredoxin